MKKAPKSSSSTVKKGAKKSSKKHAKKDFWGNIIEVTLNDQNAPLNVHAFYASATGTTCPSTCSAGHNTATYPGACC